MDKPVKKTFSDSPMKRDFSFTRSWFIQFSHFESIYSWNQHKNFRRNSTNVANIKKDYNDPRYYTSKLSNFISSIRSPVQMKLEEMSNN